jgi:hypothetical protein
MKIYSNLLTILILLSLVISCKQDKHTSAQQEMVSELKNTDLHYSEISAKEGMNKAFLAMFDTTGVLLRGNSMPVEGIQSIRSLLMKKDDTKFILTWEPIYAYAASTGELGYTYGTFKVTSKENNRLLGEGTYCTIWKKTTQNKWKAVLDTGNDGLKKDSTNSSR